jgi:SAM-dependent methyltransferase
MTIESALGDAGAPYDRRAAVYDRLVRSEAYNRLAWSASPRAYAGFAAQAAASAAGPLLEVAAGTAAATAEVHARSGRPTVLVDLSRAMLKRAADRIAEAAGHDLEARFRFVHADVLQLPFPPGGFATVLALGTAHLFEDLAALRRALLAQLMPDGRLYITGLVAGTRRGRRYLELLHRAGETAAPRSAETLRDELRPAEFRVDGCMAYAVLRQTS